MEIKTCLHFHSSDDPQDFIPYDFRAGIDAAARAGFGTIALTCHNKFVDDPEYEAYAREKGILLIKGIEKNILGRHVVILNADAEAEKLETFGDLAQYKKERPEIFVLAPHPYFGLPYCLGKKLDRNISLFDAIEFSWFYNEKINFNKKAEETARKNNLPFIATSDTHKLEILDRCYAVIDAESKTPEAIFKAIRQKKFKNVYSPAKFWKDMVFGFIKGEIKNCLQK
jgi:predicted metal-dependent phosphoesterase TrpH